MRYLRPGDAAIKLHRSSKVGRKLNPIWFRRSKKVKLCRGNVEKLSTPIRRTERNDGDPPRKKAFCPGWISPSSPSISVIHSIIVQRMMITASRRRGAAALSRAVAKFLMSLARSVTTLKYLHRSMFGRTRFRRGFSETHDAALILPRSIEISKGDVRERSIQSDWRST